MCPNQFFNLVDIEPISHSMIWQGIVMIINVYGIGYWLAFYDPIRHWPIVLVGFLGKLFGPIGLFINLF